MLEYITLCAFYQHINLPPNTCKAKFIAIIGKNPVAARAQRGAKTCGGVRLRSRRTVFRLYQAIGCFQVFSCHHVS